MTDRRPNRRELMLAVAGALPQVGRLRARGSARLQRKGHDPGAIGPAEGELVYVGRDPVRIKVSPSGTGRLAMITQDVSPGTSIPVHLHEREDEIIFIQSGSGEATLGGTRVALTAGSTLYVPQGTWHGGRNTGADTLRWIAIYSPSGFEGYFREIGRPSVDAPPRLLSDGEREARDARFGIRYQQ
jgi:mannose-6-phosphate isomerase-like protein (cupin superfamily)